MKGCITGLTYMMIPAIAGLEIKELMKTRYYLFSTDFSNFKYINKLYGYEKGDKVLGNLQSSSVEAGKWIAAADHIQIIFCSFFLMRSVDEACGIVSLFFGEDHAGVTEEFPLAGFHINYGLFQFLTRMKHLRHGR